MLDIELKVGIIVLIKIQFIIEKKVKINSCWGVLSHNKYSRVFCSVREFYGNLWLPLVSYLQLWFFLEFACKIYNQKHLIISVEDLWRWKALYLMFTWHCPITFTASLPCGPSTLMALS